VDFLFLAWVFEEIFCNKYQSYNKETVDLRGDDSVNTTEQLPNHIVLALWFSYSQVPTIRNLQREACLALANALEHNIQQVDLPFQTHWQ